MGPWSLRPQQFVPSAICALPSEGTWCGSCPLGDGGRGGWLRGEGRTPPAGSSLFCPIPLHHTLPFNALVSATPGVWNSLSPPTYQLTSPLPLPIGPPRVCHTSLQGCATDTTSQNRTLSPCLPYSAVSNTSTILLLGLLLNSLLPPPPPLLWLARPHLVLFCASLLTLQPPPLHLLSHPKFLPGSTQNPLAVVPPPCNTHRVRQWQPWEMGPPALGLGVGLRWPLLLEGHTGREREIGVEGSRGTGPKAKRQIQGATLPAHSPAGLYPCNKTHFLLKLPPVGFCDLRSGPKSPPQARLWGVGQPCTCPGSHPPSRPHLALSHRDLHSTDSSCQPGTQDPSHRCP